MYLLALTIILVALSCPGTLPFPRLTDESLVLSASPSSTDSLEEGSKDCPNEGEELNFKGSMAGYKGSKFTKSRTQLHSFYCSNIYCYILLRDRTLTHTATHVLTGFDCHPGCPVMPRYSALPATDRRVFGAVNITFQH